MYIIILLAVLINRMIYLFIYEEEYLNYIFLAYILFTMIIYKLVEHRYLRIGTYVCIPIGHAESHTSNCTSFIKYQKYS